MLESLIETIQIPGDKIALWMRVKGFEFKELQNQNYKPGPNEINWDYENVSKTCYCAALTVAILNHPIQAYKDGKRFIARRYLSIS